MKKISQMRILWLLNHSTLRQFEIDQLNQLGFNEIFLPKFFPHDEGNLSASIDYSQDKFLTIPAQELRILNEQNWYENPSEQAWHIANQYFDIAVMAFFPTQIASVISHFKGAIVLRAFGLAKGTSYTQLLYQEIGVHGVEKIKKLKQRFWFGMGYEHLHTCEGALLQQRKIFLPVGLANTQINDQWIGDNKRILFICPRINTSPYFHNIYQHFIKDFQEFDYTIGGAQPIVVHEPHVIGFVSPEEHALNMRGYRVMFYHSTEPNHIHYHPFEAIRTGMPLIFMAGGLLDHFGGKDLPGRCVSIAEAQRKIKRILKDDWQLIKEIKRSQVKLLQPMHPEYCQTFFSEAYMHIVNTLHTYQQKPQPLINKRYRIALILPIGYGGGSFRGAKSLANTLEEGGELSGDKVEVIFAHLNNPQLYADEHFYDLSSSIKRRTLEWCILDAAAAKRAMYYAGYADWQPEYPEYMVPDDGINQFIDCDLWLIVSDRLTRPLLPIKPYVCMVYDYLSRYVTFLDDNMEQAFFRTAQGAKRIMVTTEFTAKDALQYAGICAEKIFIMPMLIPTFSTGGTPIEFEDSSNYFIWTTNAAKHKNHVNAFRALKIYYEEFDGKLECHITGCDTQNLLERKNLPYLNYLEEAKNIYNSSKMMQNNIQFCGDLSDPHYKRKLRNGAFLWHAAQIDNGTFSVVEAAQFGVPSLSSQYPAMKEIDQQFHLHLFWMDPNNSHNMAQQLKFMEDNLDAIKAKSAKRINHLTQINYAETQYWKVIKECL
jgi:glycosyltransferase involved in cell wall biosynthesis